MSRRNFEFVEGSARKFWAITVEENAFTVHFGRIGTTGQAQQKSFADAPTARREADKLIAEKTRKGYVEVASAAGPAPAPKVAPPAPAQAAAPPPGPAAKPDLSAMASVAARVKPPEPLAAAPPVEENSGSAAPLERFIPAQAKYRSLAVWEDPQPRPAPAAFDRAEALQRLAGATREGSLDLSQAKIPAYPSAEEGRFWLAAVEKDAELDPLEMLGASFANFGRGGLPTPQQIAQQIQAIEKHDGSDSMSQLRRHLEKVPLDRNWWGAKLVVTATYSEEGSRCLAAAMSATEFLDLPAYRDLDDDSRLQFFREYLQPYLSAGERAELRQRYAPFVKWKLLPDFYSAFELPVYIAALLGCPKEIAAFLRHIPDNHYSEKNSGFEHDTYHKPLWLLFGLADRASIRAEGERLNVKLRDAEQAGAWLTVMGAEGLALLGRSICQAHRKPAATALAGVLNNIVAVEMAPIALRIVHESKVPQAGLAWLRAHPRHALVGLVPEAMQPGKPGEPAREFLRAAARSAGVPAGDLDLLPAEQREWFAREIVAGLKADLPVAAASEIPPALRFALAHGKIAPFPDWLEPGDLPPLAVGSGRLGLEQVREVLSALRKPLEEPLPVADLLKAYLDRSVLDAFTWKLFETWLKAGGPAKDKWALAAIGRLGSDALVPRLAPLLREWPGESQHQRAVFGLQTLRALGSDAALMALNGIALKLKYKGLQEKARELMEEIAVSRGLSSEQLADRVVPDCELDARGSRVFNFGPRQFHLSLGPELKPRLRDGAGKFRPDLPTPNASDDAGLAATAVEQWKLLKKVLRDVLKVQSARLEDAMVSCRRWTASEFEALLVRQPVMINLVRQLVFAAYDEAGRALQTFRVTEDQTLAGPDDDSVAAPATDRIGVVHPAHLDAATLSAWKQVLSDYEVLPPFRQLDRPIFQAEPDDLPKRELTRFKGPWIPGIVVFGTLESAQWRRQSPGDGGSFWQHGKYFHAANVTACIRYSGMGVGYFEARQQIEEVCFLSGNVRLDGYGTGEGGKREISEVDPIALSETFLVVHALLAKAGT